MGCRNLLSGPNSNHYLQTLGNSSEFQDGSGNGDFLGNKFSRTTGLPVTILTRTVCFLDFSLLRRNYPDLLLPCSNAFPRKPRGPGEASWCREAKIAARQFLPLSCRAITLTTGAILKEENKMSSFLWGRGNLGGNLRDNLGEGNWESKIAAIQWGVNFCREASRCLAGPSEKNATKTHTHTHTPKRQGFRRLFQQAPEGPGKQGENHNKKKTCLDS